MFLGAYWSSREESREEAARRIAIFLALAGERCPSFVKWYEMKRQKDSPNVIVPLDDLGKHLVVNRRDRTREEMLDLGLSIWLWNDQGSAFNARLGVTNRSVGNALVLESDSGMVSADVWRCLLGAAVRIFDPDRATVKRPRSVKSGASSPSAVWLTFERGREIQESPTLAPPLGRE
jgi:hypothetical protein